MGRVGYCLPPVSLRSVAAPVPSNGAGFFDGAGFFGEDVDRGASSPVSRRRAAFDAPSNGAGFFDGAGFVREDVNRGGFLPVGRRGAAFDAPSKGAGFFGGAVVASVKTSIRVRPRLLASGGRLLQSPPMVRGSSKERALQEKTSIRVRSRPLAR